MEEVLFDPQTSGGLLIAVPAGQAEELQKKLREEGLPAGITGEIIEKEETKIYVI